MPSEDAARAEWFDAVEDYNPGGTIELAQRLHDEGLLFAINTLVLHPLGLAIGVRARHDAGEPTKPIVTALCLFHTDDPEGIAFPAGTAERAIKKLSEAGHTALVDRLRVIGIIDGDGAGE